MRRPLIALALLLVAPLVCAQVYKWTDAKGVVHYSETPPAAGTKYSQVSVTGTAEPLAQPAADSSTDSADSSDSKPSSSETDTPTNRTKFCNTLQGNITTLQGTAPVVMQQGADQKLLTADQRTSQLSAAQTQYQQYCKS